MHMRLERSVKKHNITPQHSHFPLKALEFFGTFTIDISLYVRNVHICRHVALRVYLSPVAICIKSLQVTVQQNEENEPLPSSSTPTPG